MVHARCISRGRERAKGGLTGGGVEGGGTGFEAAHSRTRLSQFSRISAGQQRVSSIGGRGCGGGGARRRRGL